MSQFSDIIRAEFPKRKVVVVGDVVADQFLHGTIARVSREAPVFILRHDETETLAGGGANAAVNVAALGGQAVLVGIVGQDANGEILIKNLQDAKVNCRNIITDDKLRTTTKVRVLAGQHYAPRQQVIRIDYENDQQIDAGLIAKLKESFLAAVEGADAIIVSDYNYGVASTEMFALVLEKAQERKIPLVVDSRFRLKDFGGATSATPNQDEVEQLLGKNFTEEDCSNLREKLGYESLLITRGNKGMLLIEKDKSLLQIEAIGAKEPVDVTGAGDTVIATYSLGLASGLSFAESANLANYAGGIVVMKKGTASVTPDELLDSLERARKNESKAQTL